MKQLGANPMERTYTVAPWKNGATGEPGNWQPVLLDKKGGNRDEWEEGLRVRQFPTVNSANAAESQPVETVQESANTK